MEQQWKVTSQRTENPVGCFDLRMTSFFLWSMYVDNTQSDLQDFSKTIWPVGNVPMIPIQTVCKHEKHTLAFSLQCLGVVYILFLFFSVSDFLDTNGCFNIKKLTVCC